MPLWMTWTRSGSTVAAMSTDEEKAANFRKQRRIGGLGHADAQEEDFERL